MKLTKQTVIFPFGENGLPLHEKANVEQCMKSYKKETGYFFTPEQLNQLLSDVVKDALNTAAEKAKCVKDKEFFCLSNVSKKSITNTFKETFNKHKV